jgi:predicted nucleic acid-binding protein
MGLILLDSSFAIAVFSSSDLHHMQALQNYDAANTYIASTVTAAEVMAGAFKSGSESFIWPRLQRLVKEFIAVDEKVAYQAAQIRVERGLKTPDAIISATASIKGAQLWTFDSKLAKATPGARCLA